MNPLLLSTIIIVVVGFGYQLISMLYPKKINADLSKLLQVEDFDGFDALYQKKGKFLTKFNNALLLLDKGFLQGNENAIVSAISLFDNFKMALPQQAIAYSKAFYFYLSIQDYGKCKKYYNLLKDNEAYEDYHNLDIIYDVYVEKGTKYLDELLKQEDTNPAVLSLIAAIYSNMNNTKKVKEYENKLDQLAKQNSN